MSCTCSTLKHDGKATVDHIRAKGKDKTILSKVFTIKCECGTEFEMKTAVDNCPNCKMTYALPPSRQSEDNIRVAGINY